MTNPAASPILYSFRRCPYAIRARMALAHAGIETQLREVILRHKPQELLAISAKGTVPVLQLPNATVIDESLDIMRWALHQNDPDGWLDDTTFRSAGQDKLIAWNDNEFKYFLDRYKYADRYPEFSRETYQQKCDPFLRELESRLNKSSYLCGNRQSLSDIALFPFVRQFAGVDAKWFQESPYRALVEWLAGFIGSQLFKTVMVKHKPWIPEI